MWIVIYLVKGKSAAADVRRMLEAENMLVMTRKKTIDEDNEAFYDILVPQTEVDRAQELIIMKYSKE